MKKMDLLKMLYGVKIVSVCCKSKMIIVQCENSYFKCNKCNKPCEAIDDDHVPKDQKD